MKVAVASHISRIYKAGIAVSLLVLLTGCQELNRAVDGLLGREVPAVSVAYQTPSMPVLGLKNNILEATLRLGTFASDPEPEKKAPVVVVVSDSEGPVTRLDIRPSVHDGLQVVADSSQAGDSPVVQTAQVSSPAPKAPQAADKKIQPTQKPRPPEAQPTPPTDQKTAEKAKKITEQVLVAQKGKKRAPGELSPTAPVAPAKEEAKRPPFAIERDPFRPPTEVLPTECPPSMPLCRFDRSQLKLVGVIQLNEGQFKGMVEDPDGRGYFVTTGTQIAGATVTQVSNKGIIMHLHKTGQDVEIPLFRQPREGEEF